MHSKTIVSFSFTARQMQKLPGDENPGAGAEAGRGHDAKKHVGHTGR